LIASRRWTVLAAKASLAIAILSSLAYFRVGNVFERWSLQEQSINRWQIVGIRSLRPQLRDARAVLVVGLAPPFHPWIFPEFLTADLGYRGRWIAAVDPDIYIPPSSIEHVSYEAVRLDDYDFVVVFDTQGKLVIGGSPEKIVAVKPADSDATDGVLLRALHERQVAFLKNMPS